jgi:cytochrome c peroxidase
VIANVVTPAQVPPSPRGLDLYRPAPADNPMSAANVALGRHLFNDPSLSRGSTKSCRSCHLPSRAFTDGRRIAVGVGRTVGRRNVPTLVNRAWGRSFFWDGRTPTLEMQVLEPIFNPQEMGMTPSMLADVIWRSPVYRASIRSRAVSDASRDVSQLLATYVRSIMSGDAPYDRFVEGERSAMSPAAQRGLVLFRGKAGCDGCHGGATFTDEGFHNTGVAWSSDHFSDAGRGDITNDPRDVGAFKTPTLREVARTAPYMHDGSFATLDAVIDFYDRGARANANLDYRLKPLQLSREEKADLKAFLTALTGHVIEGL